ncbi:lipopolysaccharide biosynthesis protein [Bradyrhizobium sp. DASA03007]|uniref:lipopolysaccharide biosynthesis protein n=1 Tax=unclassified Bradyrhizobium TaxID=2631580 RepID=UPI003F70E720
MNWKTVARGVGANAFVQAVILVVQLSAVPVLASHWGLQLYGWWVIASALPSYISLADLGFATAAGTDMTMKVARGDLDGAIKTFQSAWIVVIAASICILVASISAFWLLPVSMTQSQYMGGSEVGATLFFLMVQSISALHGGIFLAGYRCSGLYALGTMTQAFVMLVEGAAAILVCTAGGTPKDVALALAICRLVSTSVQGFVLARNVPWLKISITDASWREIRLLIKPAIAAMTLPIAQASFLQGTTLALGAASNTANAAIFSSTRTLTRSGVQLVSLLNHAILPEFSAASSRGDRTALMKLVLLSTAWNLLALSVTAIILVFFGTTIVSIWTHNVVVPPSSFVAVMTATMLVNGCWHPFSNFLLAVNKHHLYSYPYAILAVASVALTYLLVPTYGLDGAAASLLLLDVIMASLIVRLVFIHIAPPSELRSWLLKLVQEIKPAKIDQKAVALLFRPKARDLKQHD